MKVPRPVPEPQNAPAMERVIRVCALALEIGMDRLVIPNVCFKKMNRRKRLIELFSNCSCHGASKSERPHRSGRT